MSTRLSLLSRAAVRSLAAACFLGITGCALTPGGPEYTELGVSAQDASKQTLTRECTPLPVLPGGTVVRDFGLAPGLSAHVVAVRDQVEVTLDGTDDPYSAHRTFPQQTLYQGYSGTLTVTTAEGAEYTVTFSSPCASAAP